MTTLQIYNFLTRKIEDFKPVNPPNVSLYTCGPTVYDFAHIGNLRTYIFGDILRRVLAFGGFAVKQIMNITDVDDKIIAGMREKRMPIREFIKPFEKQFFADLEKLNIKKAKFYPKATENIIPMLHIIGKLLENGLAYKTDDGVYFDISKFKGYGKLSRLAKAKLKEGARVASDLYEKEDWADFALWKFKKPGEPTWDAPFGKGRPGWHIECSAMALKYLDNVFEDGAIYPERSRGIDIHTGAVDLLFPHHENEIAQSEGATGKKFVNFWLEGEHLLVSGRKMAKSLGNIVTLSDIEKKGFDPAAFRYLTLTCHYRAKLNFTWESLKAAAAALTNLHFELANWPKGRKVDKEAERKFLEAVNDDLDTPKALSVLWKIIRSNLSDESKKATILKFDQVFGLGLEKIVPAKLAEGASQLIIRREELRVAGDFTQADKIRKQLKKMGVSIEDTPSGPRWKLGKK